MISSTELLATINQFGGTIDYKLDSDNYFIVFDNRDSTYTYFSVNDYYSAPERYYVDRPTAIQVCKHLNIPTAATYGN